MRRQLMKSLYNWQKNPHRKPLIIQGARQVGKTYLIEEFGKQAFEDFAVFNFEEDPALGGFFSQRLSPEFILEQLSIYRGKKLQPQTSLIFFDEIQACPAALSSLKYFCEKAPEYPIIAAGSLLGIEMSGAKSFPVGKVNFLHLYPLSFYEFLAASGRTAMQEMLESKTEASALPLAFHEELSHLLKLYLFIGGMPEVVMTYFEAKDLQSVRRVQNEILDAYLLDFSKHAPASDVLKLTQVWNSIPAHLGRENKKFIFSAISKSARAREYSHALQWLSDAGLIHKSYLVEKPNIPLNSYQDNDCFKVFLLDVGLLTAMMRLESQTIVKGNDLFTHAKGALTESFVAQELTTHFGKSLNYWANRGSAEIDFILSATLNQDEAVIPLEVKSGENTKNRSLTEFGKKYNSPLLVRAGTRNLQLNENMLNIPLYLLGSLDSLLKNGSFPAGK